MNAARIMPALLFAVASSGCTKDPSELGLGAVSPTAVTNEAITEPAPAETAVASSPPPRSCNCPAHLASVQPLGDDRAPAPTETRAATSPPPSTPTGTIAGSVTTPRRHGSVVVYVENAPSDPNRGMKGSVNQHRMQFVPHFSAVSVGGRVVFHNSDPFPHNVFSIEHGGFNLGTWGKGGARVYTFKQPGIYSLLCNLHPAMLAYVAAVPSSYFAVVKKGAFAISDVPNGNYQLTAIGPKLAPSTKPVSVAGSEARVDFDLEKSK